MQESNAVPGENKNTKTGKQKKKTQTEICLCTEKTEKKYTDFFFVSRERKTGKNRTPLKISCLQRKENMKTAQLDFFLCTEKREKRAQLKISLSTGKRKRTRDTDREFIATRATE